MPAHQFTGLAFFGGGVDTGQDPVTVAESQVISIENFVPEGDGLTLRPGLVSQVTGSGTLLYVGVADLRDKRALVATTSTSVLATTGTSFTTIGSLTSGSTLADSVTDMACLNGMAFFANLNTAVQTWTGTISTTQLTNLTSASGYTGPTNLKSRYVASFAGRVILAYVSDDDDSGNPNPHRVRFCKRTTVTDGTGWKTWTGTGAGAVDLDEHPGHITGLSVFNGVLVIFKSDSIVFGYETGDPNNPIRFQRAFNVGCLTARSFAPLTPDMGIFLSRNGFYQITAGGVTAIGDEVRRYLFGPSTEQTANRVANLNTAYIRNIAAWVEPISGSYWCSLTTGSISCPILLGYYARENKWAMGYQSAGVTGATNKSYAASLTSDPIPSQPRALVAASSSVWKFDPDSNQDTGVVMTGSFKTKDLRFNPTGAATLYAIHVHMTLTGSNSPSLTATVQVDIDGDRQEDSGAGSKLTLTQTASFSSTSKSVTVTFPVHANAEGYRKHQTSVFHRFKFTVTQGGSTSGVSLSIPAVEFEWLPRWNIQYPTTA